MTLLTVSIVRKYVILIDKSINLKLISNKNYDNKLKKKKKKKSHHTYKVHVMRLVLLLIGVPQISC